MQDTTLYIMVIGLCILLVLVLILALYNDSKMSDKIDKMEKRLLKVETILEERRI